MEEEKKNHDMKTMKCSFVVTAAVMPVKAKTAKD